MVFSIAPHYGRLPAFAICIRLDRKRLASDKHSSFLKTFVKYGHKEFYNISPGMLRVNMLTGVVYFIILLIAVKLNV